MGDIIWGTFFTILIIFVLVLYILLTRKRVEQRSLTKLISILLIIGGSIGFLSIGLDSRLLADHPYVYLLTLLFFISQTFASMLYYRSIKIGLPLLMFTLLLQIPILDHDHFSYRNQTLFGLAIKKYPAKFWDIEPGSYIHFTYFNIEYSAVNSSSKESSFGLNLLPILIIAAFSKKIKESLLA
jgi:hypothetical protein